MPLNIEEPEPRVLPVIVLADTSGSMDTDGKIGVLNDALRRMVVALAEIDVPDCQISLATIAFGGSGATLHTPLTPVDGLEWEPLTAAGRTPMGEAFVLARTLLEDQSSIPVRSHRPHLVLVSDGIPTDDWKSALEGLDSAAQAQRSLRFAVGIGAETDGTAFVLTTFAGDEGQVVSADEVEKLTEFFKFVTHTVTESLLRPVQSQTELPTFQQYSVGDNVEF